jgi:A/G-specific adenine glycosylase
LGFLSTEVLFYFSFVENFPNVQDLANASEDQVLRLWQGLGYYSRARNLHFTAKYISKECNGVFPSSYNEIIKLKGIGPYTAAAIASICFKEPKPVIDGNVFRFISRYFGVEDDISVPKTRKIFETLLTEVIDHQYPGEFNQGMMEMGALVCKPVNPACDLCVFRESCFAFRNNKTEELPVKTKSVKVRTRNFDYHIWKYGDLLAMKKRPENDIWSGLYDFHLIENSNETELQEPKADYLKKTNSATMTHQLSHQKIMASFHLHEVEDENLFNQILEKYELSSFTMEEIVTLPKPKLIVNYLKGLT